MDTWMGSQQLSVWDTLDFELDLGCGRLKKGRIGIDRHPDKGVDIVLDLANEPLPFEDSSIESVISHHFFEHLYPHQFIAAVDEVYRVLKPEGIFRCITPCFPARNAVDDPDHKMFITEWTWMTFDGFPPSEEHPEGNHWHFGFSTPYTKSRFELVENWFTPLSPPDKQWTVDDVREIRATLRARK